MTMAFTVQSVLEQLNTSLESAGGDEEMTECSQESTTAVEGSKSDLESVISNPSNSDESNESTEQSEQSEESTTSDDSCNEELPKKRGTRKRKKQVNKWKKSLRKRRRNSGQKYISIPKKVVRKQCNLYTIIIIACTIGST